MINIGTDGACKGNPGVGGWGVSIFDRDCYYDGLYGGDPCTTNNRMELIAFIEACRLLEEEHPSENVRIWIDSMYVLKGCTEWLRGWVNKDYSGVKNSDLWREVEALRHVWVDCDLVWCKGHSGNIYNECADDLANKGAKEVNDKW